MKLGAITMATITMIAIMNRIASSIAPLSRRRRVVLAFRPAFTPIFSRFSARTSVRANVAPRTSASLAVSLDRMDSARCILLSRDQRKRLPIVGQHVFHFHRVRADLEDPVAPVNDLPLLGDKDVLALGQEHLFRTALIAAEPVKLQRN